MLLYKYNTPAQASRTTTDSTAQHIHTEGAHATLKPKEALQLRIFTTRLATSEDK